MKQRNTEDQLRAALQAASDHLDYCGYGDSWERNGTEPLQEQIADALALPKGGGK